MDYFPFYGLNNTQLINIFDSIDLCNLPRLENVQDLATEDKIEKLNDIDLILSENSPNIKCEYYTENHCRNICNNFKLSFMHLIQEV